MYTLRKVIDNIQSNKELGDEYQVVDRETNYIEFCKAFKVIFGIDHVSDLDTTSNNYSETCHSIILFGGGNRIEPLYKNQFNYIMSDNGKTFSNLTYK